MHACMHNPCIHTYIHTYSTYITHLSFINSLLACMHACMHTHYNMHYYTHAHMHTYIHCMHTCMQTYLPTLYIHTLFTYAKRLCTYLVVELFEQKNASFAWSFDLVVFLPLNVKLQAQKLKTDNSGGRWTQRVVKTKLKVR